MSAVSECRDQFDCTKTSGATTKYSELAPPGMMLRIGVGARRQFDRRKEHERAAADPDRRIRIVLHDRHRTLDGRPQRISVGWLRPRHRHTGRIVEFDRRRHWHRGARPVCGRQRVHFGRHIADRQRLVQWRRQRARAAGGLSRIDFRGRGNRLCWRRRRRRRGKLRRGQWIEGGVRQFDAGRRRRRCLRLEFLLLRRRQI